MTQVLAVLGGIFLFILALRFLPLILGVSIAAFAGIGVVLLLIVLFFFLVPLLLPILALALVVLLIKKVVTA